MPALFVMKSKSKSFFPMEPLEAGALVFLVLFAAVSFLPAWRTLTFGGMAVFGWFMAALMLISPALALFVFLRGRGKNPGAP